MAEPTRSIGVRLGATFDELYPTDYNPVSWTFFTSAISENVWHSRYDMSDTKMRAITVLTYFTRAIDSIVSIFVLAYLEGQKHFLGIRNDYREGHTKTLAVKVILTPITLPLRIFGAVLIFGPFMALRMAVNVLGIGTIADVRDITNGARDSRRQYRKNTFMDDNSWVKPSSSDEPFNIHSSYSNQRVFRQYPGQWGLTKADDEKFFRYDLNIFERYGYNARLMFLQAIYT